jgi:uncharacterized protein
MKKGASKWVAIYLAISATMIFGLGHNTAQGADFSIAAGATGGSYYAISVGIGNVIQKFVGKNADVSVTGGAVENATLVGTAQSDLGPTNGDVAYEAYTGTGRYAGKKLADIRALFGGVAGGPLHSVVDRKSGIKSYGQLKGKRVVIGPQGSGPSFFSMEVLKYYGVTKENMKILYLNYPDGLQALRDGQVDATMAVGPLPIPSVKELSTLGNFEFDLLSVEKDKQEAFLKDNPFYDVITIPADMYKLGYPVNTLSSTNIYVVNAKRSTEEVYQITKAIFEHLDLIAASHPSAKTMKLENAPVTYIPMHPGAEKYFKEKGVIK